MVSNVRLLALRTAHATVGHTQDTYTLPWSVVGGASKLGFCSASGTFCGPRIVAPYGPRCASGMMSSRRSDQITSTRSSRYSCANSVSSGGNGCDKWENPRTKR